MSAPAARAKTPESLEMNRMEDKTGREVAVNLTAPALGDLLSFNSRGAGLCRLSLMEWT